MPPFLSQDAVQFFRYGPRIALKDENQFRALLARIVENVLCDHGDHFAALRRRISRLRPLPPDTVLNLDATPRSAKTPSKAVERHEKEAWIRLGMELLNDKDREVIVMRQWEDLSFEEIGNHLGISSNTARMRNERAVGRLGKLLGRMRRGDLAGVLDVQAGSG